MSKYFSIRTLLLFLAPIVLLFGCTKDVTNIKLPEATPKLVVGCFISPQDTVIVVTLSRSNPIFGSNHNNLNNILITDASVLISDGSASATVPYNSANNQYELQSNLFPIVPAKTYYLSVSTPKGESISASCTVPLSNLTAITVDFIDTASLEKININVKWQDIPNQTNYYRGYGQITVKQEPMIDTVYFDAGSSLHSDNKQDGKEMSFNMGWAGMSIGSTINGVGQSFKAIAYDIYLLNIDEEYYKYQNSYQYTSQDPFSEPGSTQYTNIKGGLGVFAAYQKFHVKVP